MSPNDMTRMIKQKLESANISQRKLNVTDFQTSNQRFFSPIKMHEGVYEDKPKSNVREVFERPSKAIRPLSAFTIKEVSPSQKMIQSKLYGTTNKMSYKNHSKEVKERTQRKYPN